MSTRIKFCGCTSVADALLAVEIGADAVGLIFAPSDRQISEKQAREIALRLPPAVTPVGVFVDPAREDLDRARAIFPDLVYQLHGSESPEFVASLEGSVIKTIHVMPGEASPDRIEAEAARFPQAMLLFDTQVAAVRGGSGTPFPWRAVERLAREREIIVGGGLNAENVPACVRAVRPYGVDVRSGIETQGRKDASKMRRFVEAVRRADAA